MRAWIKPGWVLPVGGVALTWVALFELNAYWFEFLAVSPYVGWVFLPAALRVLAVLLFKTRGVLGLFLGAFITNASLWGSEWWNALALSAVSALSPALALWLGVRWLDLMPTLDGLKGWQLLALSALAAVSNSVSKDTEVIVLGERLLGRRILSQAMDMATIQNPTDSFTAPSDLLTMPRNTLF